MKSLRAVSALRHQQVYVVTTPRRQLFGIHRLSPQDELYTSHVLGFSDESHALLIAKSLESHYQKHGAFPKRDLAAPHLHLDGVDVSIQLSHVAVESVQLADLLQRLRGTGIVVSLLSRMHVADEPDRLAFKCRDVRTECTTASVVGVLNRTWGTHRQRPLTPVYHTYESLYGGLKLPSLMPKPTWPPASAAAPAPAPAPAADRPGPPLAVQMLFAAALKCLALAEVLALFLLLPELF